MHFFKSLSIYTLTSLLNAAIPFLLLPILTHYLSVEAYGLLTIMQIFILFTFPFVSLNVHSTLQLEYHTLDQDAFSLWVSSVLVIPLGMVLVVLGFFILFQGLFFHFMETSLIWLLLVPLIALMQVVPQTLLSIYRISERPLNYAKYQLSLTGLNLLLTLILVVLLQLNWEGRVLAIFITYLLFSLVGLYLLVRLGLLRWAISWEYVKRAIEMGAPLILHVVSAALFMMSDRLFISYYLGNEALGLYAVGAQIAMIAMIVQESFNQAWVPYLFSNLKTGLRENQIKIVKISYGAILFFAFLPFLIWLMTPLLFQLFVDAKFMDAIAYVFWIALGYGFLGMYKVVTNYIFYEKRVKLLSIMSFLSLLLNLLMNYWLIHRFGAIGVAYGTVITLAIFFLVAFVVANHVHKMPWLFFISTEEKGR